MDQSLRTAIEDVRWWSCWFLRTLSVNAAEERETVERYVWKPYPVQKGFYHARHSGRVATIKHI